MKTRSLIFANLFTLVLLTITFATGETGRTDTRSDLANRMTAQMVENRTSKSVVAVGAPLTPETFLREAAVESVVLQAKRRFVYCYERTLSRVTSSQGGVSPDLQIFYFSVDPAGNFGGTSSEVGLRTGPKIDVSDATKTLHACVYDTLQRLKAPTFAGTMAFRLKLTFAE